MYPVVGYINPVFLGTAKFKSEACFGGWVQNTQAIQVHVVWGGEETRENKNRLCKGIYYTNW